ncbi:MAG: UDP-N-acetylglucosamine 2-epimerase (hydrolyzing) [Planctomycetes bacterium]|nr:UDP-N-acetylglucosamine 2-epimerase (hydrolyzing) [Planctomycetota bacterium]
MAVTCARSDSGLMAPVWRRLQESPGIELEICATGMHLSRRFGSTVDAIPEMGFAVGHRVTSVRDDDPAGPVGTALAIGRGVQGFSALWQRVAPDLVLVLGDRFDMFPAAAAALPFRIPVAHVSGGEVSYGAIDESLRHAITKLSHLHFPCHELGARRIRAMGEEDWRVHVAGAPGLDAIREIERDDPETLARRFGFARGMPNILVTQHPVSLEWTETRAHARALLAALEETSEQIIVTWPNADPGADLLIEELEAFAARQPDRVRLVQNAGQAGYLGLLEHCDLVVGNSSSGLVEAAAFARPVVNVGGRQEGRLAPRNVISVDCEVGAIRAGITRALDPAFRRGLAGMPNPYGDGRAGKIIRGVLEDLPPREVLIHKRFREPESDLA